MAKNLFVGGLPYETTQEELTKLFAGCGTVTSVKLIMDRDTGRSKGFAFVEMATEAEAQAAIKRLSGTAIGQRQIFINEARPQEKRPGFGERPAPAGKPFGEKPGFVERRSGIKDRRRQPAGFAGEKREGEKKWSKPWEKPGGGDKKWGGKGGGFGGPKKWGGKGKSGGFGGPKKWGGKRQGGSKRG